MAVLFVTQRGQPLNTEVGFFDTVLEMEEKIQKYKGIPITIRIIDFNGQELQDERSVEHCEIRLNSRIHLIIPVGYRFHPTDEELVDHFLRSKMSGTDSYNRVIREVDVCEFEPWDLPAFSVIKSKDQIWYFFCLRDVKYLSGHSTKRQTKAGYWKPTGIDRKIMSQRTNNVIGMKKTLVFYRGRASDSPEKTPWVIHEYRSTADDHSATRPGQTFILCLLKIKPDKNTCDEVEPLSVIGTRLNVISNDNRALGQLLGMATSKFQVHEMEGVPENQLVLHSTVGYRFHPTNEELVNHYLSLKIPGMDSYNTVIPEVDVCKFEPWELPALSVIKSDDPKWYFFCPCDVNYLNGHPTKRQTKAGYWKPTGEDRKIMSRRTNNVIGMKKTLVFYKGRAGHAPKKTAWVIHEYRLPANNLGATHPGQTFVLCLLKIKSDGNTCDGENGVAEGPTLEVRRRIQSDPELEEGPTRESVPELEEGPILESVPELEEGPTLESVPELEEGPILESVPELEEEPTLESVPELEEGPILESVPELEEEPTLESVPELEEEPTLESDPELEALVGSFNFEPPRQPLDLLLQMHPEQGPSHMGFPYLTVDTEEHDDNATEFLERGIVRRDEYS